MPDAVYRTMTLLCTLVGRLPIGTNLGLLHLLWMLVSGRLLGSRGALLPGLSAAGLTDRQVRRAWAAVGAETWTIEEVLGRGAARSSRPAPGSRTPTAATGQWPSMSPPSGAP